MSNCGGGRFCLMCHPRLAIALFVTCIGAYLGLLALVLWWMP